MKKELYLAGGCFWGVQKYLSLLPGVFETETGYANGTGDAPTYEDVCRGGTGHAETVRVLYDDAVLPTAQLIRAFFDIIDPLAFDRQGPDVGPQYRTGIYWSDPADEPVISAEITRLEEKLSDFVATEALPLENFHRAEEEHQHYLDKNPGGYCHIPASAFKRAAEGSK